MVGVSAAELAHPIEILGQAAVLGGSAAVPRPLPTQVGEGPFVARQDSLASESLPSKCLRREESYIRTQVALHRRTDRPAMRDGAHAADQWAAMPPGAASTCINRKRTPPP